MQQHKIEVKNNNFFVRGYITSDKAGDTYVMDVLGPNLLNAWKDHTTWFGEYVGEYIGQTLQGASNEQAHAEARAVAETARPDENSAEFQNLLNSVTSDTNFLTGAGFKDV